MGKAHERPPSRAKAKGKAPMQHRSRTRAERPILIEDPDVMQKTLDTQLRSRGLYAANILGDGNCLFRAISDQMFGDPTHHLELRREVCDYVASNPERFRLFVDEDSVPGGFDGHVKSMRIPGTYGTHIELSALASHYKRQIKVFQPGLVYIIKADEGQGSASESRDVDTPDHDRDDEDEEDEEDPSRTVARRKLRKRSGTSDHRRAPEVLPPNDDETLYIVYHAWEHYSSLRNLSGPHIGLPLIRETPLPSPNPSSFHLPKDSIPIAPPEPTTALSPSSLPPISTVPIKRGRGRPRKHPLPAPPSMQHQLLSTAVEAHRRAHSASPSGDGEDAPSPSTPGGSSLSGSSVSEDADVEIEDSEEPIEPVLSGRPKALTMKERRAIRDEEKRKKKARAGVLRRSARGAAAAASSSVEASTAGGEAGLGAVKELYI